MNIKNIFILLIFSLALFSLGCKKSPPSPAQEENLVIDLDPTVGSTIIKSMGTSYDFTLRITSKMPSQGVSIKTTVTRESDNLIVYSQTSQTSTTNTALGINNLPFNEVTNVVIEVVSKTKATNTASKTFKLVKK